MDFNSNYIVKSDDQVIACWNTRACMSYVLHFPLLTVARSRRVNSSNALRHAMTVPGRTYLIEDFIE